MPFRARAGVAVWLLSAAAAQAHAPGIGLSRIYLNFTVPAGGSSPLPQSVTLTNTTHGRMAWTATVSTNSGGNWLSVSPSAGLLPGINVYEWAALGVAVSPSSLPAGVYYGTITIRAPGDALSPPADNTPQLIEVALTVGSAGPAPGIGLSPSAVSLEVVAGATVIGGDPGAEHRRRDAQLDSYTRDIDGRQLAVGGAPFRRDRRNGQRAGARRRPQSGNLHRTRDLHRLRGREFTAVGRGDLA